MKSTEESLCLETTRLSAASDAGLWYHMLTALASQLYVRTPGPEGPDERATHPFEGYFLPFPNTDWGRRGEGLVSTINADRQLNWVYVDEETYEIKYGNRVESEEVTSLQPLYNHDIKLKEALMDSILRARGTAPRSKEG